MPKLYQNWKDYPKSEWRWPDFSPQELACRGTGRLMVDPDAMDKLQALRTKLGKPMIINSGYRSPEHNKAVGGAKNSMHMKGIAFDVRMDNHNPEEYIAAAKAVGFTGIGTYPRQNFVHVDDRGYAASWGQPFPKRPATPAFAPEEVRPPDTVAKDTLSKEILGGIGAVGAAGGGVLSGIGDLDPVAQYIAMGGLTAAGGVLCWLLFKRLKWIKS